VDVPVIYGKITGESDLRTVMAMLLTHDCEYDKEETKYVYVAQLVSLAGSSSKFVESVRQRRVIAAFYLEPLSDVIDAMYVDLRRISRIEKRFFQQPSAKAILSLSDDARLALQRQIALFFGFGRGQNR